MRRLVLIVAVAVAGCTSSAAEQKSDPNAAPPSVSAGPTTTGKQQVKGGESFSLRGGTTVSVKSVAYANSPCPPGVQCISSGIVKLVHFTVSHGAVAEEAAVNAGTSKVVAGVELQVLSVEAGPVAEIEARLPVANAVAP